MPPIQRLVSGVCILIFGIDLLKDLSSNKNGFFVRLLSPYRKHAVGAEMQAVSRLVIHKKG